MKNQTIQYPKSLRLLFIVAAVLFFAITALAQERGSVVISVALSADGNIVALEGSGGTVQLWDVSSGRFLRQVSSRNAFSINPNGTTLAFAGFIELDPLPTATANMSLDELRRLTYEAQRRIDEVSKLTYVDQLVISLMDINSGRIIRNLESSKIADVGAITFSSDGKILAATDRQAQAVKLWDVSSGKIIRIIPAFNKPRITFSLDNKYIAVSDTFNRHFKLWNIDNGTLIRDLTVKSLPNNTVMSVPNDIDTDFSFSPDGKMFAAGFEGIKIWGISTGSLIRSIPESIYHSDTVAFDPNPDKPEPNRFLPNFRQLN